MPRRGPVGGRTPTTTGTSRRGLPRPLPAGQVVGCAHRPTASSTPTPSAATSSSASLAPATTSRRIRSPVPTEHPGGPGHDPGTPAHQALRRQDRRAHPPLHHRAQWVETERWTAFRSHWGVEAFYCRPGEVGAHEKGRGRGADRLVPPQPHGPGPGGRLAGRAQRADRPLGRRGPGPADRGAAAHDRGDVRRRGPGCRRRCRSSRSRPAAGSPRAWTATRRSPSAPTATRCPPG